ncbi:class III lanthionine synthetase LanKC [Shewanella sp. KX20019]|uniref:class III lanthionine synthetase LanKC n=1 Tax=Shewanella sp. KX20019 TaxID=2803864 RepID=UPI00192716D6|nr:class III lanthionine synthetase LanKC [Shewanella sp. KX20019]QQX80931.1 class III lanthionine synthetase LanKC [Shewanella sp. KX20019]
MSNNLYTYGDRYFFTHPTELSADELYEDTIKKLLPDYWIITRKSIWLSASNGPLNLPLQGFKIHISSVQNEIIDVIEKTVACCIKYGTAFKVICRKDIAGNMNSKSCSRSSAGKLITIYPQNNAIFRTLIDALHVALEANSGPYILSDKRYKDSQVVHYRYGGFLLLPKLQVSGKSVACIKNNTGLLTEDLRTPFYQLPDWIAEPFPEPLPINETNTPLKQRYQILEALAFSNSGGVYKALDLKTKSEVVIKEARPNISFRSMTKASVYAERVLQNEYDTLQALQDCQYFPKAIDWFLEWEHSFLVEEFVTGITLRQFRASNECTLVPFTGTSASAERFKGVFAWIANSCIEAIEVAHDANIVLGDISPNNIMVDGERHTIRFIDFDGSYKLDHENVVIDRENIPVLTTPGFSDYDLLLKNGNTFAGDWYALSMVLYSMILPIQNFFDLHKPICWKLLTKLEQDCKLDTRISEVIKLLANSQHLEAKKLVFTLAQQFQPQIAEKHAQPYKILPSTPSLFDDKQIQHEVSEIARFIETGVERKTSKNFVPLDYRAFDLHKNAIAYGYYGPAVMLTRAGRTVPNHLIDKIDNAMQTNVAPGILVGSAGMALAEIEIGRLEKAEYLARKSIQSPLLNQCCSFGYGLAGIGFMLLSVYKKTNDDSYLEYAADIACRLESMSIASSSGTRYPQEDDSKEHIGLIHGSSGIALFLLQLYKFNGSKDTLEQAEDAIRYDINIGLEAKNPLSWGETSDSDQRLPYWEFGAAGIGAVIVRFYEVTQSIFYLNLLQPLATNNFSRYSAEQGSFNGLAGLGELLLDINRATKDPIYLQSARHIADSIMQFSIEKPNGHIYPGKFAQRLSTDLAFGSSGIGLFLQRLVDGQPRWLHDLG